MWLLIALACSRGSARIDNDCDCDERASAGPEDDSDSPPEETGGDGSDTHDTSGAAGGGNGGLTYTVICEGEGTTTEALSYFAEVDLDVSLPNAMVQVWAELDIDIAEAAGCSTTLYGIELNQTDGFGYSVVDADTLKVRCYYRNDYADEQINGCTSQYIGWGPKTYTINVLPMNSGAM